MNGNFTGASSTLNIQNAGSTVTWKKAGSFTPTLDGNQPDKLKEILLKQNYVVVGFEVERRDKAVIEEVVLVTGTHVRYVHDLRTGEYGHAFFYIVKDSKISNILSFGPDSAANHPNASRKKQEKGNPWGRLGTWHYQIEDPVSLFRINITQDQLNKLIKATENMAKRIESDQEKWKVITNDTCAETAKQVLDEAGIETPSAKMWVKAHDIVPAIYVDDPYGWYDNFKASGKYQEVRFGEGEKTEKFGKNQNKVRARIGQNDPVAGEWN